jgi:hypothetical protein
MAEIWPTQIRWWMPPQVWFPQKVIIRAHGNFLKRGIRPHRNLFRGVWYGDTQRKLFKRSLIPLPRRNLLRGVWHTKFHLNLLAFFTFKGSLYAVRVAVPVCVRVNVYVHVRTVHEHVHYHGHDHVHYRTWTGTGTRTGTGTQTWMKPTRTGQRHGHEHS